MFYIHIRLVYFAVDISREVVPRIVYPQALSMQIEKISSPQVIEVA
jgi:hypothetical protein